MESEDLVKKYKKMYNLLDIIDYLFRNKNDMDVFEMNQWISKIVSFYKVYGIELSVNDFKVSNAKNNSFLNRYMTTFFDNIDRLDDDSFSQLLFKMNDLDVSCESDNPILLIVRDAVKGIKIKNIKILDNLFDKINRELVDLGIGRVNLDNMDNVREKLENEISNYDNSLEQLDKNQELNDSYEKYLIELLVNSKENTNVDAIKNNLYDICLLIVRLKIFYRYRYDYMNYAKACGYKKLLNIVKRKMIKYKKLMSKSEMVECYCDNNTKEITLSRLNKKIEKLKNECSLIIANYLYAFYEYINMDFALDKYEEFGIFDTTKLFGLFDFESVPRVSSVKLENMGIESIDVNMDGFDEISELAFDYIKKNKKNNILCKKMIG